MNDSLKNPNCVASVYRCDSGLPLVIFKALRDIEANEELRYSYGLEKDISRPWQINEKIEGGKFTCKKSRDGNKMVLPTVMSGNSETLRAKVSETSISKPVKLKGKDSLVVLGSILPDLNSACERTDSEMSSIENDAPVDVNVNAGNPSQSAEIVLDPVCVRNESDLPSSKKYVPAAVSNDSDIQYRPKENKGKDSVCKEVDS